jgi:hypothetical protein
MSWVIIPRARLGSKMSGNYICYHPPPRRLLEKVTMENLLRYIALVFVFVLFTIYCVGLPVKQEPTKHHTWWRK